MTRWGLLLVTKGRKLAGILDSASLSFFPIVFLQTIDVSKAFIIIKVICVLKSLNEGEEAVKKFANWTFPSTFARPPPAIAQRLACSLLVLDLICFLAFKS